MVAGTYLGSMRSSSSTRSTRIHFKLSTWNLKWVGLASLKHNDKKIETQREKCRYTELEKGCERWKNPTPIHWLKDRDTQRFKCRYTDLEEILNDERMHTTHWLKDRKIDREKKCRHIELEKGCERWQKDRDTKRLREEMVHRSWKGF